MELKIVDVSWHRNGVGGTGFYAVLFDDAEEGRMVASLFDEPSFCAVYKVELLAKNDVAFGSNSWRGDRYEEALRPLVESFLQEKGTNRMGPFSIPVL
jgi:hypothetical protein